MQYLHVCLTHGRMRNRGGWIQFTLRKQDLDNAFEFLGVTIIDAPCDECRTDLQRLMELYKGGEK